MSKVAIVVVGFKVSQENSVFYRKVFQDETKPEHLSDIRSDWWSLCGELLARAYQNGAEFVSVRFVKNE